MHNSGNAGVVQPLDDALDHLGLGVAQLIGVDSDDDGGVQLLGGLDDTVEHIVVTDVEGRDSKVVLVGNGQQFFHVH